MLSVFHVAAVVSGMLCAGDADAWLCRYEAHHDGMEAGMMVGGE